MECSINCSNQRPPPTPHRVEPLIVNESGGLQTQAGYVVVRTGPYLVVVGSAGTVSLDQASLESFTSLALSKLAG